MANSLDNLSSYYLPNTLDGINVIFDDVSTSALLVDGTNFMLADLNMNNHNIKNLDAGTDVNDAVNLSQIYGLSSTSKIYSDNVSSASRIYSNTVSSQSYLFSLNVSSSSALYTSSLSNNVSSSSFIYSNSVSSSSKLYADSLVTGISSGSFMYANSVSSSSFLFATSQSSLKISKTGDTVNGNLIINGNVGINTTPSYNLHVSGTTYIQGPLTATGTVTGDGGVFSGMLVSDDLIVNTNSLLNNVLITDSLSVNGTFKVDGSNGNPYQFLMSQGVSTPSWIGIGKEYKITVSGAIAKQYDNSTNDSVFIVVFESSSFTIDPYHSAVVHFLGMEGGYVGQRITGGSGSDGATVFFRAVSGSNIYYATTEFPWNGVRGQLNAKATNEFGVIYIPRETTSQTFTIQLYANIRTDDLYSVSIVDSIICIRTQPTYQASNLSIS